MGKQLAFFHLEEEDDYQTWSELPEKNRHKIETILS